MTSLAIRVLLMCSASMLLFATTSGHAALVPPATTWLSANPGGGHTCGIAVDGLTYCWGQNQYGQLGIGSIGGKQLTPRPIAGGLKFAHLSAGTNHNCGLTADGDVYCWGTNLLGQLGIGSLANSATPKKVATTVKFVAVSAGFTHTCGIAAGGAVYCWGDGRRGQLGNGNSGSSITRPGPVPIPGLRFMNIAAGAGFTCGRTQDLKLFCWGDNSHAQLGAPASDMCPSSPNKQAACSTRPIAVAANQTFFFLGVGFDKSCAVNNERTDTVCWGAYKASPGTMPASVPGGAFDMLAVGGGYACGLRGGEIRCWGNNSGGVLGNGTTTASAEPVPVSGAQTFGSVRAGQRHACAITTGRQMFCWGSNLDGQLGNGSTTDSLVPVAVQ